MVSNTLWSYCQENSDAILADGLYLLKSSQYLLLNDVNISSCGNYLISYADKPYYIGEASQLKKRVKQQLTVPNSQFYKDYFRLRDENPQLPAKPAIEKLQVQLLLTQIGRKEIEEFGTVNLPAPLNRFQKAKRQKYNLSPQSGIWLNIQENSMQILEEGVRELSGCKTHGWLDVRVPYGPGIYWVENHQGELIYLGESSNIQERYKNHSGHTYISALRRHVGTELFRFILLKKKNRKRYFLEEEDAQVTAYLRSCHIKFLPVSFGRCELEEYLIKKHNPLLNRKGKTKLTADS